MSNQTLQLHARPKPQQKNGYFCRLCRRYNIKTRKAHLQNAYNVSRDTVTKRCSQDLVDVVFIEAK